MATKRMLVDASHPEETRVVVVSGNRVEDFDVEVESRRQLKGNIYLAKVTRVEPSLQAAFVDYGGNRHGFLAFSEIHPDYYQIPVADREALLAEEETAQREAEEAEDAAAQDNAEASVEEIGGDEDEIDVAESARRPVIDRRRYKIQEVIKRRQILLVQVVKEERGNKGAALTTYLSLAGRYCVLMPNTARGGGISRKIASGQDRKRLKNILADLGIPEGMAVIVRTAGAKRTKAEIKRDYEYLIRLWEQIRQKTLESMAPSVIHEEGNLIKRSIRDIYSKEIEEVVVDGEEGYKTAKTFMKLMMPSHAKKVQPYKESSIPLLQRYQVESQIDSMHQPEVHLRSGGYIVINSTEALVAIDVNSGRSTRERNIEETALKTNLEAADEVARQLRLRDLAGLIVIDFIDMENHRNQVKVERALKDAMRSDRARIQIGRISPFGLLEMSRQRLRPSLLEMHSEPCPHCGGTGIRRSADTTAVHILRVIEEEAMRRRSSELTLHVPTQVALYILNQKREQLAKLEADYEVRVFLESDDTLIPPDYRMERVKADGSIADSRDDDNAGDEAGEEGGRKRRRRRGRRRKKDDDAGRDQNAANDSAETEDASADSESSDETAQDDSKDGDEERRPKRRRRGRRAGRKRASRETDETTQDDDTSQADDGSDDTTSETQANADTGEATDEAKSEKPKRRSRRRRSSKPSEANSDDDTASKTEDDAADVEASADVSDGDAPNTVSEAPPASDAHSDAEPIKSAEIQVAVEVPETQPENEIEADEPEAVAGEDMSKTTVIDVSQMNEEKKPARRGWWRRG